jgi:hypothetical protein
MKPFDKFATYVDPNKKPKINNASITTASTADTSNKPNAKQAKQT